MKKTILAVMIAVVVVGCNSSQKRRKPVSNVVAGRNVSSHSIRTVRGYEIVKEYTVGRRIDPQNPNIMYGACKMYVIRRSPTWNLRPNVASVSRNQSQAVNYHFKELKEQKTLRISSNKTLQKLTLELAESKLELQKVFAEYQKKKNLLPVIKQLQSEQNEVIKRLANLRR